MFHFSKCLHTKKTKTHCKITLNVFKKSKVIFKGSSENHYFFSYKCFFFFLFCHNEGHLPWSALSFLPTCVDTSAVPEILAATGHRFSE